MITEQINLFILCFITFSTVFTIRKLGAGLQHFKTHDASSIFDKFAYHLFDRACGKTSVI